MFGFPEDYNFRRPDFEDMKSLRRLHINMMLDRTRQMFTWSGLPDSIPEKWLEIYLQIHGYVIIAETDIGLKAFFGGLGSVPDEYYKPTKAIVNNPYLNYNKTLDIYRDYHTEDFNRETGCVVGQNDTMMYGLYPLIWKYAEQLATNEITLNISDINSRAMNILAASSDKAAESVRQFLKDLRDGKIATIRDSLIKDTDVRSLPFTDATNGGITNLIELHQYYKASFYNEIGLNANYNMKRESIQQNESDMNHDSLKPLIDDMMECRQELADMLNKCYDLDVSVDFNSIWENRAVMEDAAIEQALAAAEDPEEVQTDPEPEPEMPGEEAGDDNES